MVTRSIAPGPQYPGLLAHDLGDGHEIVVIGWGEEAERVLAEAVAARIEQREKEFSDG